jgi:hypothetical protein
MSIIEVDRVRSEDRRQWDRAKVCLRVRLVDTEGSFDVRCGQTLDICVGGLRAQVDGPLSGAVEATVYIDLTDERAMVCEARVAGGGAVGTGWEYGLAFRNLDPADAAALADLVDAAS